MKSKALVCAAVTLLFAAMSAALAAQAGVRKERHHQYHHYQLINPGTLGGPVSYISSSPEEKMINSRGAMEFYADTSAPDPLAPNCYNPDCFVSDAVVWQDGVLTDLPALVPGYSSLGSAINASGEVVGESENGLVDPLTAYPEIFATLWKNGIVNLGTLGGNQSVSNGNNDRGQVAGAALNADSDPFASVPLCNGCGTFSQTYLFVPAGTQSHAFRWTETGGMHDLGTLGGPDSSASFVNQRGQIMGESFTSFTANPSTGVPTLDPFFWENGKMVDIGTLGGTIAAPNWMNNRGQVVGASTIAGDQISHAFLWDKRRGLQDLGILPGGMFSYANSVNDAGEAVGGSDSSNGAPAVLWKDGAIIDLGNLAGDICSGANSINSSGEIVGFGSADCNNEDHAFLSENGGPLVDLQTLVLAGSGVTLTNALFINDQGEIAARDAFGDAILLIPCDENHPGVSGCDYDLIDAETAAARVSPAPAIQHPAPLSPRSRMPGMLNRWRGFQRIPGFTTVAPDAKQTLPSHTATDYLQADHSIGPARGRRGYCTANSSGLTGSCVGYSYTNFCSAKRSAACPRGLKAIKPGYYQCSLMQKDFVDLGRSCSY